MTTYNIQIEVSDGTTVEQLHEDLCLVIHEEHIPELVYLDIGHPVEEPEHRTNVPITEWDNRDPSETWLWIDQHRYVCVDPVEMIENMIENCCNWFDEETDVPCKELEDFVTRLKGAIDP